MCDTFKDAGTVIAIHPEMVSLGDVEGIHGRSIDLLFYLFMRVGDQHGRNVAQQYIQVIATVTRKQCVFTSEMMALH